MSNHMTVNERLSMTAQVLAAQNEQLRMTMGVLVKRLGGSVDVTQDDLLQMQRDEMAFVMTAKPGTLKEDGTQGPDHVLMEVLTKAQMAERQAAAPRIEAPQSSLIVPGR